MKKDELDNGNAVVPKWLLYFLVAGTLGQGVLTGYGAQDRFTGENAKTELGIINQKIANINETADRDRQDNENRAKGMAAITRDFEQRLRALERHTHAGVGQ